jgi:hypothetical protein
MSEVGIRLTIGSVLSLIWFAVISHFTDWPAFLVFLAAILCGFCLSVLDVILIFVIEGIFD